MTPSNWQPMEMAPKEGKFLVAKFAPTSWEYWVTTVHMREEYKPRHREMMLMYARAWMPLPPPPAEPQEKL